MGSLYVDSSAWCKLLADEAESAAFVDFVDRSQDDGDVFVSSALLVSEVLRAALRLGVDPVVATSVLAQVHLFVPDMSVFRAAGLLGRSALRALDALHVAACLAIGADVFVSYDGRQVEAANAAGIATISPAA